MRKEIVHENAGKLVYEIREIVQVARKIESMGQAIHWENIGDPIHKGEPMAPWILDKVSEVILDSRSYGYTDSQGDLEARRFIAESVNNRDSLNINKDDVIFFNGLGDAINKIYSCLKREARVIGPSPAYSTHSSAEAAHSGYEHLTYKSDPHNNWLPDIEDLENKVKYNDSITGILIINPDNPTGSVYSEEILRSIVAIAKKYNLFIISDETYANVTFPGVKWTFLSSVIGDVPGISMRSLSKEFPWPGSRCGWIEVYNRGTDRSFSNYIDSIVAAKRVEVCSTTQPQLVLPKVMGDIRYSDHLESRARTLSNRADEAFNALEGIDGISYVKPKGSLYYTVFFKELPDKGKLEIHDDGIREYVEGLVKDVPKDKRFVYYLLGATGICVVPLSGFYSNLNGFRFTLLEHDNETRRWIYKSIADAVRSYLV